MGLVLPDGKTSITDDIRSPISTRYKIIVRLETYLLLFMQPNTVVIVHEAKDSFEIANQYKIPDFDGLGVKMHKINGTKVLAVVPGATCVHLLSDQGVTLFRNGIDNILSLVVLNGL